METLLVNVVKGQRLDLTKGNPNLKTLKIGLGWDENRTNEEDFDLDVVCIGLNSSGMLIDISHVCYFNQLVILGGSVKHSGDNLTGAGSSGDKETITINLQQVPPQIDKFVVAVNIFEASKRRQNFGMVSNSYCKCYDSETGRELMKYDLGEEYSVHEGVVFGEIYRHGGGVEV